MTAPAAARAGWGPVLAGVWLAACGGPLPALLDDPARLSRDVLAGGKHRGMSYAHAMRPWGGYGSEASAESLRRLRELGVDWISITPFGYQRGAAATAIRWVGNRARVDETDARLRAVVAQARERGMRVMLKPHIWLRPPDWPGTVEPRSEADWRAWFAAYREFVLHYARLAQDTGIEAFCIGNELEKTTVREREWRSLVQAVREVYSGAVTYGATFTEVERVAFWDELDFIGVSAYYPLVAVRSPDRAALAGAWSPVRDRLAALASRWGKKVVFTELGYRSADFGAWKQWQVTDAAPVNLELQADAYAAFFDVVWPEPWLGGVYFWKWFSHRGHSGPGSNDYELEGKPAERVLAEHYRRGPAPPR